MACARPIEVGTNKEAPPSGISPIAPNPKVSAADSLAATRSQASASEKPTPAATPLSPHTTGLSQSRTAWITKLAASTDFASYLS